MLNSPARLNEKGDMCSSFQATHQLLAYFAQELTPIMLESGVPTIEVFSHGLTLALALSKMEKEIERKGSKISKRFARQYAVYSYSLHLLSTQLSAVFGHQTQGRKTPKSYMENIYTVDNLTHMFRELVEFPNKVKVNERMFEAMLKEIREYINISHQHLTGLTDFFNRKELKAKWGIKTSTPSGKPGVKYSVVFPDVTIKGSVMNWRYPSEHTILGLPVCATLTRGFWTELLDVEIGDCPEIEFDTEKMETRYCFPEEKSEEGKEKERPMITIHPSLVTENDRKIPGKSKVPELLFSLPETKLHTELRQLFDCFAEGKDKLPTRCLGPLFRAARVKTFLEPLASADLVDKCLDLLECYEEEGTFDFDFFKYMVLHFTHESDFQINESCLEGVDVQSVMK